MGRCRYPGQFVVPHKYSPFFLQHILKRHRDQFRRTLVGGVVMPVWLVLESVPFISVLIGLCIAIIFVKGDSYGTKTADCCCPHLSKWNIVVPADFPRWSVFLWCWTFLLAQLQRVPMRRLCHVCLAAALFNCRPFLSYLLQLVWDRYACDDWLPSDLLKSSSFAANISVPFSRCVTVTFAAGIAIFSYYCSSYNYSLIRWSLVTLQRKRYVQELLQLHEGEILWNGAFPQLSAAGSQCFGGCFIVVKLHSREEQGLSTHETLGMILRLKIQKNIPVTHNRQDCHSYSNLIGSDLE